MLQGPEQCRVWYAVPLERLAGPDACRAQEFVEPKPGMRAELSSPVEHAVTDKITSEAQSSHRTGGAVDCPDERKQDGPEETKKRTKGAGQKRDELNLDQKNKDVKPDGIENRNEQAKLRIGRQEGDHHNRENGPEPFAPKRVSPVKEPHGWAMLSDSA